MQIGRMEFTLSLVQGAKIPMNSEVASYHHFNATYDKNLCACQNFFATYAKLQ